MKGLFVNHNIICGNCYYSIDMIYVSQLITLFGNSQFNWHELTWLTNYFSLWISLAESTSEFEPKSKLSKNNSNNESNNTHHSTTINTNTTTTHNNTNNTTTASSNNSNSNHKEQEISFDKLIQTSSQFQNILNTVGNEKLFTFLVMAFVRDNKGNIEQCLAKLKLGKLPRVFYSVLSFARFKIIRWLFSLFLNLRKIFTVNLYCSSNISWNIGYHLLTRSCFHWCIYNNHHQSFLEDDPFWSWLLTILTNCQHWLVQLLEW